MNADTNYASKIGLNCSYMKDPACVLAGLILARNIKIPSLIIIKILLVKKNSELDMPQKTRK